MRYVNKTFILIIIAVVGVLIVFFAALFLLLNPGSNTQSISSLPTPTPFPLGVQPDGRYKASAFEKTVIGKTTRDEVVKNLNVVSESSRGSITIYTVESDIPNTTDEIWVEDDVAIFESTNTQALIDGNPPKILSLEKELGSPEEKLTNVGLGEYTSIYLYPSKGIAFLVNPYTGSVYEIYRFLPMSLDEFRSTHPNLVAPAPTPVPEYPF